MCTGVGVERMNETKIIYLLGEMRQQVRYHFSGLSMRLVIPKWLCDISTRTLERDRGKPRWFFPIELKKLWFVVKRIDVTYSTGKIRSPEPALLAYQNAPARL